MSSIAPRSRGVRIAATIALSLGVTAASGLATATSAPAAPSSFIAAPNGMVGVPETITIKAPSAAGQVVTIGLQLGPASQVLQTTIASNGFGSVTWTPTGAGGWTINGLGSISSAGSTTTTVVPMPTYTVLLAQNQLQQGVTNNVLGAVVAPIGTLAPTGNLTLSSVNGGILSTAPLSGQFGTNTATATLPWNPGFSGAAPIQATYQPASGGQGASTSPISQPNVTTAVPTVAMRWPENLYIGTSTVLQAVLGQGIPDGSAAFLLDGQGISPSIPTVNGVASFQWTPPTTGVHTIGVLFSGAKNVSGSSFQSVNILGALTADNITVNPPTQPVWSVAQPIVMRAGTSVTLVGTSASGTPVLFSEQGPCAIAGAVLTALSAGQCQVTAITPGNSLLTPGSETYTLTVQAPPRKKN
ncbi:MAG: hypothetical protein IPO93_05590 [Actinobacteria bacterium]|jgi:hypothetical protein|nr:hypothetical protein [Actinomycetota bacterium]